MDAESDVTDSGGSTRLGNLSRYIHTYMFGSIQGFLLEEHGGVFGTRLTVYLSCICTDVADNRYLLAKETYS